MSEEQRLREQRELTQQRELYEEVEQRLHELKKEMIANTDHERFQEQVEQRHQEWLKAWQLKQQTQLEKYERMLYQVNGKMLQLQHRQWQRLKPLKAEHEEQGADLEEVLKDQREEVAANTEHVRLQEEKREQECAIELEELRTELQKERAVVDMMTVVAGFTTMLMLVIPIRK